MIKAGRTPIELFVVAGAIVAASSLSLAESPAASQPASSPAPPLFTARFTPESLEPLLRDKPELLPLPLQLDANREAAIDALNRIAIGPLLEAVGGQLSKRFGPRFMPAEDLITTPVPADKRIAIPTPELEEPEYRGPERLITGFVVHDITKTEYIETAVYLLEMARQKLETGEPIFDRTHPDHLRAIAERNVAERLAAHEQAQAQAAARKEARRNVARALGLTVGEDGTFTGEPHWAKESRRFSYIIEEGRFIERLEPLVLEINRQMDLAGFPGPSPLEKPGIYFDPDLQDVEIVLPRPMLDDFLVKADELEQRMAEERIISIEAVRLTDRDIIDGAIASRLNAQVQGVHDVERFDTKATITQLGINSLLAVANQRLQIDTFNQIQAGAIPDGVAPVAIATPTYPPILVDRRATTIGSTFSVGADDLFFDGREQSIGFSYIGPDGIEHTLGFDVVDSLREFWDRIERNLIVHKIKKVDQLTEFSVPVGPDTKTYEGIAALISQETQQLVVATGTGAISEIDAIAGTWLIINDFQITPVPGSSTALTEDELQAIRYRVLLTMVLRDPLIDLDTKRRVLLADDAEDLGKLLEGVYADRTDLSIRPGRNARTYRSVFEQRFSETAEDSAIEKKERNSKITLSFFSSQGNIIQQPGTTQLGAANDLTTFTTELQPNTVTPISSFFTKSDSGAKGTSPLTGIAKGERTNQEKTMAHLIIRARFPTARREKMDREEGRYLGYFELPITKEPASSVNLPFLSSSEHPLERLAMLRVGLMFDSLQEDRVRRPLELINPNSLSGTVPLDVWETATTRMLMTRKIISDSPADTQTLAKLYRQRFILEVRSLLEYDEDFNAAPNFALRNMEQWNDPGRIVLALHNSAEQFALERLIVMLDELGELLVPDLYAEQFLAVSPPKIIGGHELHPLDARQLQMLRRDVANHFMRFQESYGDAFLEAVSRIFELGTYRPVRHGDMLDAPLRGYHDLVVLSIASNPMAEPARFEQARELFALLKRGGEKGGLFEPSMVTIEDLPAEFRPFVIRGREILPHR